MKTIKTGHPASALSFCSDGHTLGIGTMRGKVLIYNLKKSGDMKPIELKGHTGKAI